MSEELERVHTINLGKVLLSQPQHRSVRALNMIREFARRHMKTQDVKIDEDLARQVWSRGARSPPRRIRVRMHRTDMGHILVSRYDGPIEPEPAAAGAPAVEDAAATTAALEGSAALGPAKEAPSLPEPGTDVARDSNSDSDSASDTKAPDTGEETRDGAEAPPSTPTAAAATAEKDDAAEQGKSDGLQAKAADPANDDNEASKLDDAADTETKAEPGGGSDDTGSTGTVTPAQSYTDSDSEKTGENPDASDTGSEQSASDESQPPPAGKDDPDAAKK